MKFFVILFIYILNFNSLAQEKSLWDDFTSPVTTPAIYVTISGLAATALVVASKDLESYKKRESFDEARPFRDYGVIGETLGWGFLNLGYMSYQYYQAYENNSNSTNIEAGNHMLKASAFAFGWTILGKTLVHEKRPGYPDDDNSFPSGHSSASFAFASVVAARHGWYYGGPAYFAAFFIAMSRINDDFHYLHDTLIGATIGAAYGWGIYYNYQRTNQAYILPTPLRDGGKIDIVWNF